MRKRRQCDDELINITNKSSSFKLQASTPIFTGDGEGGSGFAAAGGLSGYDFGVDPNLDPELALALRVSMEERKGQGKKLLLKRLQMMLQNRKRKESSQAHMMLL